MYYITALTALYESVAMIVDQHQPVVEKYYGAGKMIPVVEKLLDECDRVTKMLLDGWEEERRIKRHVHPFAATCSHANSSIVVKRCRYPSTKLR